MDKAQLRNKIMQQLRDLNKSDKEAIEKQLSNQLFQYNLWNKAKVIGITHSQTLEWDTVPIIERALLEKKTVTIPKCDVKSKQMTFYKISNLNQLKIGYSNILEPDPEQTIAIDKNDINLLIVPGVLFDYKGYRIGFGGGYYDRFLTNYNHATVSLASEMQLIDNVPCDSFDIPVDCIITENNYILNK